MTTTTKPETTDAERVAELKLEGMDKSDAVAKVAEERSLAVTTIRAAYGRAHPTQNGKTAQKLPADPVEAALALLYAAVEQIDEEVAQAQETLKTAADRKALLEAKIKALV